MESKLDLVVETFGTDIPRVEATTTFIKKLASIIESRNYECVSTDNRLIAQCQLCSRINKTSSYKIMSKNIQYMFPSSCFHYYSDHKLKPSKSFYDFVMAYEIKQYEYPKKVMDDYRDLLKYIENDE